MSPDAEVLAEQGPQGIALGTAGCRSTRRAGNQHYVSATFFTNLDEFADLEQRDRPDAAIDQDRLRL